jgi:hypothetical protein
MISEYFDASMLVAGLITPATTVLFVASGVACLQTRAFRK